VLTLEGHKVTLRVYVAVTSLDPLRLYVYHNGLVRICSRKYTLDPAKLNDVYVHVDSIDINERNTQEFEKSVSKSDLQHEGLRCDTKYLLSKLTNEGHNGTQLWLDIEDLVVKSFTSAEKEMWTEFESLAKNNRTRRAYPFEMVGYDVLVDKHMKPYLLEINNTPSMAPHTSIENGIKQELLRDLFTLVDIQNKQFYDVSKLVDYYWQLLKQKPSGMQSNFNMSIIQSKDDLWAIVETELEHGRSIGGGFHRVFPTAYYGDKYLKYLENPRNQLIQQWVNSGASLQTFSSLVQQSNCC